MRLRLIALAVALGAGPADAATSSGWSALAVATIVGGYSPLVSAPRKSALARILDGIPGAVSGAGPIRVNADRVVCRAGDVDITAFGCDLTFKTRSVHLAGRRANELFASLADMGAAKDGAAGTIYVSVTKLQCVVDPAKVARHDGGGADCVYAAQ